MLSGTEPDERKLSVKKRDSDGIVGVYPVYDQNREIIGAVIVDKSQIALPDNWRFVLLLFNFIAQVGAIVLILVGVPAIPIGIVVGIRRARAIGRPVLQLATAAESFGVGDLKSHIENIKGENELADLQHGFNNMADLLQSTMATEAEQRSLAEQSLVSNRDLIANVSHELRTPVALIRGHLEALEEDRESKDAYIRIALREADRLVDDLFQLSRLEANRLELDLAPFDAAAAVRSSVESLVEPARREAGLTVIASVEFQNLSC